MAKVEESVGFALKTYETPSKMKADAADDQLQLTYPQYQEDAPEWTGVGFWLSRGSRPESSQAVTRITRRLARWTAEEDKSALHLFGYYKKHPGLGLTMTVWVEDETRGRIVQIDWADAD